MTSENSTSCMVMQNELEGFTLTYYLLWWVVTLILYMCKLAVVIGSRFYREFIKDVGIEASGCSLWLVFLPFLFSFLSLVSS